MNKRPNLVPLVSVLLLAAAFSAAVPPAPAVAADGAWRIIETEYVAPPGGRPVAYDSRRDRMLLFADALYAFDFALARWTRIETTGLPAGTMWLVVDPVSDRLIAYAFGNVFTLDLSGSTTWELVPHVGPQPPNRNSHSCVYDPIGHRMIVFGGSEAGTGTFLSDAWAFDLTTDQWSLLAASGTGPLPRRDAYVAFDPDGNRLLVFGGVTGYYYSDLRQDVWSLALSGTPTWSLLLDSTGPTPRMRGAAGVDAANRRFLIFGGDDGNYLSQLYGLDLDTYTWTNYSVTPGPAPRTLAGAFFDPERHGFVIFAGWPSPGTNDVWAYSAPGGGANWLELRPTSPAFTGRADAAVVWDPLRERATVYGGSRGNFAIGEAWRMSSGGSDWQPVSAEANGLAIARTGASAVWDPVRDRMLVFGGAIAATPGSSVLRDVLALGGGDAPDWSAPAQILGPSGRMFAAGAYDPVRDRVLYFAGYPLANARNQLWSLNLGGPSLTWTQLAPAGTAPAQRYGHTMNYDPSRDRMIVFGGGDGVFTSDLYVLSLAGSGQWTKLVGPGTPPAGRSFHSAIYDPLGDRLIVQGGEGPFNTFFADTWEYRFDGTGWREMDLAVDPDPASSVALYDPHLHRMLMLSQRDAAGERRDTWSLDLAGQTTDVPTAPLRSGLALEGAMPNPSFGAPSIAFTLPDGAAATLELLDLGGRRIQAASVGGLGAGRHVVELGPAGALAPGLYFARLTRAGETRTAKICVAK